MKRFIALVLLVVFTLCLTGCMEEETVPEEKNLEVLSTLQGSTLEKTHEIEGFEFITTYNTGDYNLSRWRITDSKVIDMSAEVANIPEGATLSVTPVIKQEITDSMSDEEKAKAEELNDQYDHTEKKLNEKAENETHAD